MFRRPALLLLTAALAAAAALPASAQQRQKIGVAFGGGSAKGIAHVGVIRWFEEHRIPIDVAAGTSMGGLVGGCYATGMDSAELDQLLSTMNWDELFGASSFAFKNIRRKADARAYPSRLEFGARRGITPPTSPAVWEPTSSSPSTSAISPIPRRSNGRCSASQGARSAR